MFRPSMGRHRKNKEHVIYKELFAYVPQSKLLMHQFKARQTLCGHVTYKQVYVDKRSCKERTGKRNSDHAMKACGGKC